VIGLDAMHTTQIRQVYGTLDLLGDLGGVFGSILMISTVLHWMVTGNDQPQQVLSHYYRVEDPSSSGRKVDDAKKALMKSGSFKTSVQLKLLYGTILRYLCCLCLKLSHRH
jgi:hypothetical protein